MQKGSLTFDKLTFLNKTNATPIGELPAILTSHTSSRFIIFNFKITRIFLFVFYLGNTVITTRNRDFRMLVDIFLKTCKA